MLSYRFLRPVSVCVAVLFAAEPRSVVAQPAPKQDAPDDAAEADYAQHMQNGVTLYQLKHYAPALVEFQAAYKAKPKASPLVNEALCLRELFRYPEAVGVLERALAETHDPLDAANRKAAEAAIAEMRPLIAYLELAIDPTDAKVTIDGVEVPKIQWSELEISPNEHTIVVESDGWKTDTEKLTIASGEHKKATIALKMVKVPETPPPDKSHADVQVPAKPPEKPPESPKPPIPPKAKDMGVYVLVEGGGLYPTRLPVAFQTSTQLNLEDAANNFGALGGFRVGYRVNTFAAFEGIFQYSNVTGGRHKAANATTDPSQYSFSSWRLGPMLRLMSPGKIVRFVGTLGGGFVFHSIRFQNVDGDSACRTDPMNPASPTQCADGWGVDFFASTDVGVEFSIGSVLIGASIVAVLDSTKGAEDFGDHGGHKSPASPYANDSLPFIGPLAHFGYAFW